jgi:uncharacterized protein (DUF433 family)
MTLYECGKAEALLTALPLIVKTPDTLGGKARIAGHRISVRDVAIWREQMGKGVEEIATEYGLTSEQVYAALNYYHGHRLEIDREIQSNADLAHRISSGQPMSDFIRKDRNGR